MPRAYDLHQMQISNNPLNRPVAEAVPHYVKDMSEFLFNLLKQVFEAEVKFFINGILGIIGMATEPVAWVEPIIGVLPSTKQIIQAFTGISDGDWQDLEDWVNKIEDTAGDAIQLFLDVATLKSMQQIDQDVIKLYTDFIKALTGFTQDPGTIVKAVHDHIINVIAGEFDDVQSRMKKILSTMQDMGADVTSEGKESQDSFKAAQTLCNELDTNINRIVIAITNLDHDITTTSRGANMVIDYVQTAVDNLGGAINTVNSDAAKLPALIDKITVNMDGKEDYRYLHQASNDFISPVSQMTTEVQSLPTRARVAGSDGANAGTLVAGFGELAKAADDLAQSVDTIVNDFFNALTGNHDPQSAADYITNLKHAFDALFKDWNDFLGGLFGQGGTVTPTGEAAADLIDNIKKAVDAAGKMVGDLSDAISGITHSTAKDAGDVINHLKDSVNTAEQNAQNALKIMADGAASILDDANAAASDLTKALNDLNKVASGALTDISNLLNGITGQPDSTPGQAVASLDGKLQAPEAAIKELKASSRTLPLMQNASIQEFSSNGTWTNPSPTVKVRIGFMCINAGANGVKGKIITWVNTGGAGVHGGVVYREFFSTDLPATLPITIGQGGGFIGDASLQTSVGDYVKGRNGVSYWDNGGFYVGLDNAPGNGASNYSASGDPSIACDGGKPRGNLSGPGLPGESLPKLANQKAGQIILCGGGGGGAGDQEGILGALLTNGGNGGWPGGGGGYPYGKDAGGEVSGKGGDGVVWVLTYPNEDH